MNRAMVLRGVRSTAAAFAVSLVLAITSCLSPTLPVPPPDAPPALREPLARLLPDAKTIAVEGSGAVKGAIVALWNEELQEGTIVKADDTGAYRSSLPVDVSCVRTHNHVQMWQTDMEGKNSEVKTFRLPNSLADVTLPPDDAGCPDAGVVDASGASDVATE